MSARKPQTKPAAPQPPDPAVQLHDFMTGPFTAINGWCLPQLWYALWPLSRAIGPGPIAEIGLFEGKFFAALVKTFDPGMTSRHAAIDVFDMQQFNLDGAGVGKREVFMANLDRVGIAAPSINVLRCDSLALQASDAAALVAAHGAFKAFSVDGCHDVTHTTRDIEFAMQVTAPEGVIFVDDYTNADWPGVVEAVAKMYLMRDFSFVPLVVTSNKLILCSLSYHATYLALVREHVKSRHPTARIKQVTRFGFPTLTITPRFDTLDPF